MKPLGKKRHNEIKEYEALEKQLMALYRSGVYVTAKDVQDMAKALGYDEALKERETALRNLLVKAKKDKKLEILFDKIAQVIDERVQSYEEYAQEFSAIAPIVNNWKQRARSTKMILHSEKQKALSGAYDDDKND
jgi:hypothetical protein